MTLREEFEREVKQSIKESSLMKFEYIVKSHNKNYIKWLESKLNASVPKIAYMSSYQKGFDDGVNAASNDILSN